jgi:hypothetical protein
VAARAAASGGNRHHYLGGSGLAGRVTQHNLGTVGGQPLGKGTARRLAG